MVAGETFGLQNRRRLTSHVEFDSLYMLHFMLNTISSNRINVTIGNQIFSIPSDKIQQVINFLASLQSIHVAETPSPFIQYQGKSLITG